MSRSHQHTQHTDTLRNRIARDERNVKRRRQDVVSETVVVEPDFVDIDLDSELGQRFEYAVTVLSRR